MVNRFVALLTLVTALGATLASPARARAAEDSAAASASGTAAAKAHFKTGTTYYDLGKFDDAIREFEAAYEAKSDPAFLFNLAQAHRLAGHPTEALHFYRTYLRYVPEPPNLADIQANIRTLEKAVADKSEPGGAGGPAATSPPPPGTEPPPTSTSPGRTVASPPAPINAPPVLSSDAPASTVPPPVQPGPDLGAPGPGAAPSGAGAPAEALSSRRKLGKTLAIAGGSVFGVGLVFGLLTRSASNDVESAKVFDPSVQSRGQTFESLQWVSYLLGGLTAGVGIYFLATSRTGSGGNDTALVPWIAPGSGGALVRVSLP